MRILFTTQSGSLRMFDALREALDRRVGIERAGFAVADRRSYRSWLAERPDFEKGDLVLLKEWELTRDPDDVPDLEALARYECALGGAAGLFGAVVADRRLFMGPDCSYSQDYRRRFSDDELLCILQRGLREVERVFDEVQPEVLVGFICVTMLDYLAYLFARARGIRILNLRPTRMEDRVGLYSTLNDPAPELVAAYERVRAEGAEAPAASEYLRRVREEHGRYEGVVRPSARTVVATRRRRRGLLGTALGLARNYVDYVSSEDAADNHVPNPLRAAAFHGAVNPVRARAATRLLDADYVTPEELQGRRYAFFPLHTEPEVSLLVYGRPFVNQIEVIRSIAMSLPVDMVLVVKEHPWMVGKRSLGAYRKILNIPRVRLAKPDLEARQLVQGASLVAVITGSVALEAAILGKPVLTFGDCPYNILPDSMVRRCEDLRRLPAIIKALLHGYRNDEAALRGYVSAVLESSVSLNLYSVLLGKRNVHSEREAGFAEEVERLAEYVLHRGDSPSTAQKGERPAAEW